MIAMPIQNASLRPKLTDTRRLPRRYSTLAVTKHASKTHENSHGTIHFNKVAVTAPALLSAPATAGDLPA
ncbi:hypothetical protein GCM10009121_22550 [Rhodanobacter soli]